MTRAEYKAEWQRRDFAKSPDKYRAADSRWRTKNRELIRERRNLSYAFRVQNDPEFRVLNNLRTRLRKAVSGAVKSQKTRELLGCTIPELRAHLEAKFRPGMTWGNYGPVWHIDHIRPCSSFDLLDPAQQRECFHYTNMQPLFAEENLKKKDKYD